MTFRSVLRPVLAPLAAGAVALGLIGSAAAADTRLADAARDRDVAAMNALIAEGADVDAFGSDGTPALHWMVRVQDSEAVAALLDAGADPSLPNRYGVTPLHLAAERGDAAMTAQLLAAGADPNATDIAGDTVLVAAVRAEALDVATTLLDGGAEVDRAELGFGQTPLMFAARQGDAAIAELLITHGANVNAQAREGATPAFRMPADNSGSKGDGIIRGGWPVHGMRNPIPGAKTPLLYAAREGHADIARMLLDAGADIERADANGITPLIDAILNDHVDVARLLIDAGANINVADWYGETPLWSAVDVRNRDMPGPGDDNGVDRDAVLGLIRMLLEKGADPNPRIKEYPPERRWIVGLGSLAWVDVTGQTPFFRAAASGDVTTMRLLLDHGADPNINTFEGTTPLMAAAGVNWVFNQSYDEGADALLAAVELCWEQGADVNAVNSMGIAAVHGAANRGSDAIVEFLHDKGARLDVADNEGRTPMTWAKGVFLATNAPFEKTTTVALIEELEGARSPEVHNGE